MVLTPHPHLPCRGLKKGKAIHLPTLRALVAYKGGTFTFTFNIPLHSSNCSNMHVTLKAPTLLTLSTGEQNNNGFVGTAPFVRGAQWFPSKCLPWRTINDHVAPVKGTSLYTTRNQMKPICKVVCMDYSHASQFLTDTTQGCNSESNSAEA